MDDLTIVVNGLVSAHNALAVRVNALEGARTADPNPWSHEHWNMAKQGHILKEHGTEKCEQLAKAAGTKVGGVQPSPDEMANLVAEAFPKVTDEIRRTDFLLDLDNLMHKHRIWLSHEDTEGAFILVQDPSSEIQSTLQDWVNAAIYVEN